MPLNGDELQKVHSWLKQKMNHQCPICHETGLAYEDRVILPLVSGGQLPQQKTMILVSCTSCHYTFLFAEHVLR